MDKPYTSEEPARSEIDTMRGALLLEFGDNFCGYCRAAQPAVARALDERPDVRHIKIADGRGRPLGRSYGVKLWPTLVFVQDGREVERLVRPVDHHPIAKALRSLTTS